MSKLYLVPTPVGNLEDMTLRAIRILKEVDLIVAEDTRTSSKLLKHYQISTPMLSHHMHNEHQRVGSLVGKLKAGESIALISDAGTPGISDPGFLLAREAIAAGVELECLPGATAAIPALVASGLPCDKFVFEGFLPVKKGRKSRLEALARETRTFIVYESPYKIEKTLEDFALYFGALRRMSAAREISKVFEEHVRGSVAEVAAHFKAHPPKGEFVLVVEGTALRQKEDADTD